MLPGSLVALLLCTCHRWDRVTAKLIAAIDDSGLPGSVELDELAESLLSDEVVAVFPLAWVSPEWLEFDTAEGTTRTVKVCDDMVARARRRLEPRCAAGPPPGHCATIAAGWTACWRAPTACRRGTATHCCTARSTPPPAWQRSSAASWCAGRCAAASPGSAGRRWTSCASSTAQRQRCAVRLLMRIGRCGPGARPEGQNRASHSCQAWHLDAIWRPETGRNGR